VVLERHKAAAFFVEPGAGGVTVGVFENPREAWVSNDSQVVGRRLLARLRSGSLISAAPLAITSSLTVCQSQPSPRATMAEVYRLFNFQVQETPAGLQVHGVIPIPDDGSDRPSPQASAVKFVQRRLGAPYRTSPEVERLFVFPSGWHLGLTS
jgi:hypothetical protein